MKIAGGPRFSDYSSELLTPKGESYMLVLFILYLLVTLSLLTFTLQYADKSYSGMIKLLWYLQQTFIVSLALTYDSHCLYRST